VASILSQSSINVTKQQPPPKKKKQTNKEEKKKKVEQQMEKSHKEVHLHPYTFHNAFTKRSIFPFFCFVIKFLCTNLWRSTNVA
jgi:quinol-cytochrome oxidoreductase complex cytochrome b subunit